MNEEHVDARLQEKWPKMDDYGIVIGFPELNDSSWMSKASRIIDRTIRGYPSELKVELYRGSEVGYGSISPDYGMIVGYRGIVCLNCMSIAILEDRRMSDGVINTRMHRCQSGHLRQIQMVKNKEVIFNNLEREELPLLMNMVIAKLEDKLGLQRYLFAEKFQDVPAGSNYKDFINIDAREIAGDRRLAPALMVHESAPINSQHTLVFLRQSYLNTYNYFNVGFSSVRSTLYGIGISLGQRADLER